MGPRVRNHSMKCVALLLLMLAAAVAQRNSNYEKNYNSAKQYVGQGRFTEAEWSMRAALAEVENASPEDARLPLVLFELSEIYRAQGKYADAEPLLVRLLALNEKQTA